MAFTGISFAVLVAALLGYFSFKLRKNRLMIRKLQEAGLVRCSKRFPFLLAHNKCQDMPSKHSFIWGHLQHMGEAQNHFPPASNHDYGAALLARPFTNGLFYIDTWPFSVPLLVITTPTAANALQKYSPALPKPEDVNGPLNILCAGPSMMTMPEDQWRQWRLLFNSSFSITYLTQLAPTVASEISIFCGKLREVVEEGKDIRLEPLASRLTIDVVGCIIL